MSWVKEILDVITGFFKWWVIVEPWEQGLRVRFGKHIKKLRAGLHFRIPFLDMVYIQESRMRMVSMSAQTVTSLDGKTITLVSSVGYSIEDVVKLYTSIAQPDSTICNTVLAAIADFVATHDMAELSPGNIEKNARERLERLDYGLRFEEVRITNYAVVKTLRLIMDGAWVPDNLSLRDKK